MKNKMENLKLFPCEQCGSNHFKWLDNIVLVCDKCNAVKYDKSIEQLESAPFPNNPKSKILME